MNEKAAALLSLVAILALANIATSEEPPFEQMAFTNLVAAIRANSRSDFTALGDAGFRAMPDAEFSQLVEKFAPMFELGYDATFLGEFNLNTVRVYYWKVKFANDPNDWLAKMGVEEGQIKGFLLERP